MCTRHGTYNNVTRWIASAFTCVALGGVCSTGSPTWQNTPIAAQSGQFTVEFDATPNDPNMDGLTTLSLGAGSTFNDFAVLVRFNESGIIDVRNGSGYAFDLAVSYTVGMSHHFRVEVNVPNHTYSVHVTPPSSPEVTIATDYAFRSTQSGVGSLDNWGLWSGIGTHEVCNFIVVGLDCNQNGVPDNQDIANGTSKDGNGNGLPDECEMSKITSAGLLLSNAELLWVRSYSPLWTVAPTVGSLTARFQGSAGRWLYFLTSECFEGNPEIPGCLNSKIQLAMTPNVEYDIIAWTEAVDRRQPQRTMLIVAEVWTFHPADVNMDSLVNCKDTDSFSQDTYDWNLDGEVTQADLNDLSWLVSGALSDVNGDGMVAVPDLLALLAAWGPCPDPPEACPGDGDCDGEVSVSDLLRLLSMLGP